MTWEIITSLAKKGLHKYSRCSLCMMPKTKVDIAKLNPNELRYIPNPNEVTFKTKQGDFYTFIQDEYNVGIFKYLKDFFDGKISFNELAIQIVKFKKPSQGEELSLVKEQLNKLDNRVNPKLLERFGYPNDRFNKIKYVIIRAKNGSLEDQAILKELHKTGEFDALADEYLYRYIRKGELDKILSGEIVEAGKGGHATAPRAFDVMPNPNSTFAPYRVKFRVPITTDKLQCNKKQFDYYTYHKTEYYPSDASTVTVNTSESGEKCGTVLHTSPIETIKNFIDKFIAPLRRYSPKQDLLLSEDNMYKYLETPLIKILSKKELEMFFGNNLDLIKEVPLKHIINGLKNNHPSISERSEKLLAFLKQKYGINFSEPNMYRFVDQAEKDLVTAGKSIKSGEGGINNFADCFDITTDPYLNFHEFRLKLKSKLGDKDVSYHRNETYYHLNKPEYTHNDVESIDVCVGERGYFRVYC